MTLTSDVLESIRNNPYTRIEDLEYEFDRFTKSQLLQVIRRLRDKKIEWKPNRDSFGIHNSQGGSSFNEWGWVIIDTV